MVSYRFIFISLQSGPETDVLLKFSGIYFVIKIESGKISSSSETHRNWDPISSETTPAASSETPIFSSVSLFLAAILHVFIIPITTYWGVNSTIYSFIFGVLGCLIIEKLKYILNNSIVHISLYWTNHGFNLDTNTSMKRTRVFLFFFSWLFPRLLDIL